MADVDAVRARLRGPLTPATVCLGDRLRHVSSGLSPGLTYVVTVVGPDGFDADAGSDHRLHVTYERLVVPLDALFALVSAGDAGLRQAIIPPDGDSPISAASVVPTGA